MIHTFECDRTGTADRGFGRPNRPEYSPKKIQNVIDDPSKHFKLFIDTIANDCHLRTSSPIPDGGDCGLLSYHVLLHYDSEHLDCVNLLQQKHNYDKLEATD